MTYLPILNCLNNVLRFLVILLKVTNSRYENKEKDIIIRAVIISIKHCLIINLICKEERNLSDPSFHFY
jgi:hypothetical protein